MHRENAAIFGFTATTSGLFLRHILLSYQNVLKFEKHNVKYSADCANLRLTSECQLANTHKTGVRHSPGAADESCSEN